MYCIDIWTLPGILKALPLYSHVSREMAVVRFQWFGGTVHDVLANAHVLGATFHLKVEKAIGADDVDHLCNLSFQGTSAHLKHRFAHMRVSACLLHNLCNAVRDESSSFY